MHDLRTVHVQVQDRTRERNEYQAEVEALRQQIEALRADLEAQNASAVTEPVATLRRCRKEHAARRAIDAEYGIFLESIAVSPAQDLVWCKKQCRKRMHKQCFQAWSEEQGESRTLRCVHS